VRLELGDSTIFGRAEGLDIVLHDAAVSREHARIFRRNLSWMVEDLESLHGTWVNGDKVEAPRPLLKNDEVRIGASRFLFDSEFDIQNADYSDKSVYFVSHSDETMKTDAVAVLPERGLEGPERGRQLDFVAQMSELFDSTTTSFSEALKRSCERTAALFHADGLVLMLWDSAAASLRTSVAVSQKGAVLADGSIIDRVWAERRAVLFSDRRGSVGHPAPDAPAPPPRRSVLCAPLFADQTPIGVLYMQRDEADAYSLVDLRNARAVARLTAVFIEARQKTEAVALKQRFGLSESRIVGTSPALAKVMDTVARVAPTNVAVLIMGETGTGKEMLAREIHNASPPERAAGPFVPVNCSAVPETLFESLFFGHEKGAFTGAIRMQAGFAEQARGGTIFLDEIGELSLAMQPKLLRFLQEKSYTRVGGNKPIRADVRLVCATNRDLQEEVRAGRFREDLFHRISVMPVVLPPLRDRRADIAPLAEHFAQIHARNLNKEVAGIGADAIIALERYDWPGNVRELSNCIERAVLLCDGKVLLPRHLAFASMPRAASRTDVPTQQAAQAPATVPMVTLEELERRHIDAVLKRCGGSQVRAAEVLGIHRNTLRKKIQDYGIE